MVLRTMLGDGRPRSWTWLPRRLSREQVILAGTRDVDRDEAVFISDAPHRWLRPADLLVPDRVAGRVSARGFTKVYVHLDLDVLDPVEFPDSLMQTPGGVSIERRGRDHREPAGCV
jgi:arginase